MSIPAMIENSSPETCCEVPLPADAMLILPRIGFCVGDEFRNRFYWSDGFTSIMSGWRMKLATGAMSRRSEAVLKSVSSVQFYTDSQRNWAHASAIEPLSQGDRAFNSNY